MGPRTKLALIWLLLSTFPVLNLWNTNADEVPLSQVGSGWLLALIIGLVWLMLGVAFERSGTVTAYILFVFWVSEPVSRAAGWNSEYFFVGALLLAVPLGVYLRNKPEFAQDIAGKVVLVSGVMVLFAALSLAGSLYRLSQVEAIDPRSLKTEGQTFTERPDIYYICLDAYTGNEGLQKYFGFDNTPFLTELKKRGFYVAEKSRSNYSMTHLSLVSQLNMGYLPPDQVSGNDYTQAFQMFYSNRVMEFLRGLGYKVVYISSGNGFTEKFPAEVFIPQKRLAGEFVQLLLAGSPAARLFESSAEKLERQRILFSFEALAKSTEIAGPKFVFSHIMAPHPPFVLGTDSPPKTLSTKIWIDRDGYIAQLKAVNQLTLDCIDRILEQDNPIIIIQGDHGSAFELVQDTNTLNPDTLLERFSILNAIHADPNLYPNFYPTLSPVNTFRALLAHHFGQNIPLLPDETFQGWYHVKGLYKVDLDGGATEQRIPGPKTDIGLPAESE